MLIFRRPSSVLALVLHLLLHTLASQGLQLNDVRALRRNVGGKKLLSDDVTKLLPPDPDYKPKPYPTSQGNNGPSGSAKAPAAPSRGDLDPAGGGSMGSTGGGMHTSPGWGGSDPGLQDNHNGRGGSGPCSPDSHQSPSGSGSRDGLGALLEPLGLGFLTPFVQAASPALSSVLVDLPVVGDYVYRLVESGLPSGSSPLDPGSELGGALTSVLHAAGGGLLETDTGSVVSSFLLGSYGTDLTPLATAGSLVDALGVLGTSPLYSGAASSDGVKQLSAAGNELAQHLVSEVVSPGGRLSPLGLAHDVASTALDVVDALLGHLEVLRGPGSPQPGASGINNGAPGVLQDVLAAIQDTSGAINGASGALHDVSKAAAGASGAVQDASRVVQDVSGGGLASGPTQGGPMSGMMSGPTQKDYRMKDDEYTALCRLKENLSQLLRVLRKLSSFLDSGTKSSSARSGPGSSPGPKPTGNGGWEPTASGSSTSGESGGQGGGQFAFVGALRSAADSLGLSFLTSFVESALPALGSILSNAPVAADFTYKMIRDGMSDTFFEGKDRLSRTLHTILGDTFAAMANTTTGSIVADSLLARAVTFGDLADTRDLPELVSKLRQFNAWSQMAVNEPFWSKGSEDAVIIVHRITRIVQDLVWETVSPSGRLDPLTLAREVTEIAAAFTQSMWKNATNLRRGLNKQHRMTDREWAAFAQLRSSLKQLSRAITKLQDNVERVAPVLQPSPTPSPATPSAPYVPWPGGGGGGGDGDGDGGPGSKPPGRPPRGGSRRVPPPPPPPPPPSSPRHDAAVDALKAATDKLGVRFVISFVQDAYPSISNILADGPIASSYLYKMLDAGLTPQLADPSGVAAGCIYRILHATFHKLSDTDVGGLVISSALEHHDIDLWSLASAPDFSSMMSVLRRAAWLKEGWLDDSPFDRVNLGPMDVLYSVLDAIWETASEAYTPYGRLDPVTLAADVTDVSLVLVNSTVVEADTLRYLADVNFRMDDDEYWALWRMRTNLESLFFTLMNLSRALHQRM